VAARVRRIVIHLVFVRLERGVVLVIGPCVVAPVRSIIIVLGVVDAIVVVPVLIVCHERHFVVGRRGRQRMRVVLADAVLLLPVVGIGRQVRLVH
jgi:hypothetical protein